MYVKVTKPGELKYSLVCVHFIPNRCRSLREKDHKLAVDQSIGLL